MRAIPGLNTFNPTWSIDHTWRLIRRQAAIWAGVVLTVSLLIGLTQNLGQAFVVAIGGNFIVALVSVTYGRHKTEAWEKLRNRRELAKLCYPYPITETYKRQPNQAIATRRWQLRSTGESPLLVVTQKRKRYALKTKTQVKLDNGAFLSVCWNMGDDGSERLTVWLLRPNGSRQYICGSFGCDAVFDCGLAVRHYATDRHGQHRRPALFYLEVTQQAQKGQE